MKTKLCTLAVVALVAWSLKRHYAGAGADDLWWILSPTAHTVGALTGTAFVRVTGEGYVSYERLFVIEKSCAGVNFLIAAIGMVAVALVRHVRSGRSAAAVLASSLLVSYVAAVVVNAVRIAIALGLAGHPVNTVFDAAQVHRVEGISVYFTALLLLYDLVRRFDGRLARVRTRS